MRYRKVAHFLSSNDKLKVKNVQKQLFFQGEHFPYQIIF